MHEQGRHMCMNSRTAPEAAEPRDRARAAGPEDPIERVLKTHIAPVTGLEREVALILFGRRGWMSPGYEDGERG
jgi:hypothetical protein